MTDSLVTDEPDDPGGADFDDAHTTEDEGLRALDVDLTVLHHPVVLRSLAGVAICLTIVLWPDRSDVVLARLVGLGLIVLGMIGMWSAAQGRPIDRTGLAGGLVVAAVGAAIVAVPPERAGALLGRILGVLALLSAARIATNALGRQRGDGSAAQDRAWPLAQAGLLASIGVLLVGFPTTMLTAAIVVAAAGWAALAAIVVGLSLDRSTEGVGSYHDAGQLLSRWIAERPKSADDRQALYAKILYDGPSAPKRIARFFTLMGFAAVISSTGVIGDSTAVVIGAMLIAPLMTPLMGMAISLVMGWPNRLGRSTLIGLSGIAFAIGIGLIVGIVSPVAIDTTTNSQILARTSPTTLDLYIAIAAGAAGAYGLSRPDVSDSLPGVAIAISLVPPLSVVGISFSQGDVSAGSGALLLFATNMVAILIVGGLTFVVTGVTPLQRLTENQHRTRTSLAAIGGLAAVIIGALLLNGAQAAQDLARQGTADDAVVAWLEPYPDHDPVQIEVDGDTVTAVILGPSEGAPQADALAERLAQTIGRSVTANVRLVVEERDAATASP